MSVAMLATQTRRGVSLVLSNDEAMAIVTDIRRARYSRHAVMDAAFKVYWRVAISAQAQRIRSAILAIVSCVHHAYDDQIERALGRFTHAA